MGVLEQEGYRYIVRSEGYCFENDCGEVMLTPEVAFLIKGDQVLDHGPVEVIKNHLERLKLVYKSCGRATEAASIKLVTGKFNQNQIDKMLDSKKFCRRLARLH